MRTSLFIYSLISLCLMLYQCTDYHHLLAIPYWSFALQTVYFGTVLVQSIRGRKSNINENAFHLIGLLYEFVFSFQLFNFLYYWLIIFPGEDSWGPNFVYKFAWLSMTVFSFIAIWMEQLFNMMKLNMKHLLLIFSSVLGNLCLSRIVTFITGGTVYFGVNILTEEKSWITLVLLLLAPVFHFLVGNKHYQHKKSQKNDRRRKLTEALVSIKAVQERRN